MWERRRAVRGGLMVKVLIVENEGLFRDMLKISLGSIPNMEIVDTVCDGLTAIQTSRHLQPDVVLMDIELGGEPNGIEAGRTIKSNHPDMGMILLSAHKEREYVCMIASDDLSGWSYVLKQFETIGDRCRSFGSRDRRGGLRIGGNGPGSGQQHEAA